MRCSHHFPIMDRRHDRCIRKSKTPACRPGLRAIAVVGVRIIPLPQRTGRRKCLLPVSAFRLGWRRIWRGFALGGAMTEHPFTSHRAAALALLTGDHGLSRKAGSFLGQLAVDPTPMTVRQAKRLAILVKQAGLPPYAGSGAI